MSALKQWLEEKRAEGRKGLLAELKKTYPQISSTSISQYAHGKRIPDKEKAEIIARFIGASLELIPFRMTNQPGPGRASHAPGKIITVDDTGNGGAKSVRKKTSLFRRLFFFGSISDK